MIFTDVYRERAMQELCVSVCEAVSPADLGHELMLVSASGTAEVRGGGLDQYKFVGQKGNGLYRVKTLFRVAKLS